MKELTTYLTFDGNARQAMTFYAQCLEGDLQVMSFGEMPPGSCGEISESDKDRVMHSHITKGSATPILMASDTMPGMPFTPGTNFSISITCETMEEIQKLAALGENGAVTVPLQDMFWGAHFGMLKDRFGIHWMFNYQLPKQG